MSKINSSFEAKRFKKLSSSQKKMIVDSLPFFAKYSNYYKNYNVKPDENNAHDYLVDEHNVSFFSVSIEKKDFVIDTYGEAFYGLVDSNIYGVLNKITIDNWEYYIHDLSPGYYPGSGQILENNPDLFIEKREVNLYDSFTYEEYIAYSYESTLYTSLELIKAIKLKEARKAYRKKYNSLKKLKKKQKVK